MVCVKTVMRQASPNPPSVGVAGGVLIVVLVISSISITLVTALLDQFLVKEREIMNFKDYQQTRQVARLTLLQAEETLALSSSKDFVEREGMYQSTDGQRWYRQVAFDDPAQVMTYSRDGLPNMKTSPGFILEQLPATFS